jgi:hypothetical protein
MECYYAMNFSSPLKLPMALYRNGSNGLIGNVGNPAGFYWSSSLSGDNSNYGFFDNIDFGMVIEPRAYGFSVRCIKD